METVPVDVSDPLAMLVAWALTALVRELAAGKFEPVVRPLTPLIAVLLACFVRVVMAQSSGEPLTIALLLRAIAAGAAAVMAHSQFRELIKIMSQQNQPPTGSSPKS